MPGDSIASPQRFPWRGDHSVPRDRSSDGSTTKLVYSNNSKLVWSGSAVGVAK